MKHFGVNVQEGKYGLELCREKYAIINNKNSLRKFSNMQDAYADEEGKSYTSEWCSTYREKCLENYDLNMRLFSSLNHEEFENEIIQFINQNGNFVEVNDLNDYSEVSGYYIMILDKYCQLYIGTTENIKRRIQQHWTKTVSFDRLLFPMDAVDKSILSIDCFRALDTTRIFAYQTNNIYEDENKYINKFSPKFVSNRIPGGLPHKFILDGLDIKSIIKQKDLK